MLLPYRTFMSYNVRTACPANKLQILFSEALNLIIKLALHNKACIREHYLTLRSLWILCVNRRPGIRVRGDYRPYGGSIPGHSLRHRHFLLNLPSVGPGHFCTHLYRPTATTILIIVGLIMCGCLLVRRHVHALAQ